MKPAVPANLEKGCLNKTRLADEATARATAMHMLERGFIKRTKAWVYPCGFCRGWHITTHGGGANYGTAAVTVTDPYVLQVRP